MEKKLWIAAFEDMHEVVGSSPAVSVKSRSYTPDVPLH